MRRKSKLPELLAPAGSFESLVAAVAAGADAVYVGGKRFGARAYAKNFDTGELSRALSYCHLHGVKLYVTVNTLVEDREMREVLEYAAELYRIGVDALIIADVGALSEIRRAIPDLELHASTQMSVHSLSGAEEAFGLGCVRVVPARELSLENIRTITENSSAEVEVFLHGALCVSYSGQCLFSSMVGGRSGNRGECAQPCRLPYNGGKYPLSLRDLSLADHIPELIESGVASLKIEGRMKSPDYVFTVTKIYRTLLDECRVATPEEHHALLRAFSRSGFTDGYFVGKPESPMTGVRSEADKQESREAAVGVYEISRVPVSAEVKMLLGEPSVMTLRIADRCVTVTGDAPTAAQNAPLTEEGVKARLCKMGNTFLSLAPENISLVLGENINLSPGSVNALRRAAAEKLEDFSRPLPPLDYSYDISPAYTVPLVSAQFFDFEEYMCARKYGASELSIFDVTFVPLFSPDAVYALTNGVSLPAVVTDSEEAEVVSRLKTAKNFGVKYALVGNLGHIALVKRAGLIPVGDFRLNITNGASLRKYLALGLDTAILSPELTLPQARDIGGSLIVYGRVPLMLTERCFMKENFGCHSCSSASLTDRKGEQFPMMREHPHRNIIFNSAITYMGDKERELGEFSIDSRHFIFSREAHGEIISAIRDFKRGAPLSGAKSLRRIGRR